MACYRQAGGEMGKTSPLSSRTWAASQKGKCQGGRGGCSCRDLPASLLGTSTSPYSSFPKLLCLRSQDLLYRAAVTPCAAVCTTKPIASFVEAFNDSGAGSSPGTISTASRIPPSVAACSRNPRGAELTLAPREMCYQDVWSLLYFHSNHPCLWWLELNQSCGHGQEQRRWEGSGCLHRERPCLPLAGMARVFSAGMLANGLRLGLFLSW